MSQEKSGGLSHWLVRQLRRLLVLVVVFLAGAAAMHLGMHAGDKQMLHDQHLQLAALQSDLTQARADLAGARSQADVQAASQRTLQDTVADLQRQLGQVRDQLAFYEQLIPPGPAGAVAIRAFDLQQDGDLLRYRVLLTRNAAQGADAFKGRLRFVAQARDQAQDQDQGQGQGQDQGWDQDQGKPVKIVLNPPSDTPTDTEIPLTLEFDQFQRSTGVLQVPPGLRIQQVRLEILEGNAVRANQDIVLNRAASSVQESQP